MFETQKNNSGIYAILAATISFAAGYSLATYRATHGDIRVSTQPDNTVYLSYKQTPSRLLQATTSGATLGTLRERLDDLLKEDPREIRQLTTDILVR